MNWTSYLMFLPSILLFGIGYLVRFRKMYWLISGYNTMSAEKKQKVDTEKLGMLIGNMCFAMGLILFVGILLISFGQAAAGFVVLALILPVIIYTIITAQKYDGNTRLPSGRMKPRDKIIVGAIVLFLLAVFGFVSVMVYQGFQPMSVALENDALKIAGSYGQKIPLEDMQKIELLDVLPEIQMRTNGSAIGDNLRGHFRLKDLGQAMLYLNRSSTPFIFIETKLQKVYLNMATSEQTKSLFTALSARKTGSSIPTESLPAKPTAMLETTSSTAAKPTSAATTATAGTVAKPSAKPSATSGKVELPKGFSVIRLTDTLKARITGVSYPAAGEDCRITYDDLRYIKLLHYDFDGNLREGELIVNAKFADEVMAIFIELYKARYPLTSVKLVDDYGERADDNLSMAANNTSAFNYRYVSGTTTLSRHSYGAAIDINPMLNPYINGDKISPENGAAYADRTRDFPGKIDHQDLCYKLFIKYGWSWGGDWSGDKDYQHFSKKIS